MSSSVFPLYMLPTITSIQPAFGNGRVGSLMEHGRYRSRAALSMGGGASRARRQAPCGGPSGAPVTRRPALVLMCS